MNPSLVVRNPLPAATAPTSAIRIAGLDWLRFLAAANVVVTHLGPVRLELLERWGSVGWLVSKLYGLSLNGPAAVIVFFVISGFCIHLPHRGDHPVNLRVYFARRLLRIGIPLMVVIWLAPYTGAHVPLRNSILWSVIAEVVYYALYPWLRLGAKRWGWEKLIAVALGLSYLVVFTDPTAENYPSYGDGMNWLLGLPCWLLGCLLAERFELSQRPNPQIWRWRIAIWGTATLTLLLRFHTPATYPWTLNLFAFVVYFWLRAEINRYRTHAPWRWGEAAGRASYSLYLVHLLAVQLPLLLGAATLTTSGPAAYGAVAVFTWLFYQLVESPSHRLAKYVNESLSQENFKKQLRAEGTA